MDPLRNVTLVRHGTVRFEAEDGPVVYVDPFQLEKEPHDADLIIVTHAHPDHFSPEDLRRAARPDTCFVSIAPVLAWLEKEMGVAAPYLNLVGPASPELFFECGVMLAPLPAENKNHPAGAGFGALLGLGGFTYYVAGDTDLLADVPCDVLFVTCDGVYNMTDYLAKVPAQLARLDHKPGVVVPYHYAGYIEGTDQNGPRLAQALNSLGFPAKLLIGR